MPALKHLITLLSILVLQAVQAGPREDIDLHTLAAALGAQMPDGSGVAVTQVEAQQGGAYLSNPAHPDFIGKTFIDQSGTAAGVSGHADEVGIRWYGISDGVAPGIPLVRQHDANEWGAARILNSGGDPQLEAGRIQSHSWIGVRSPGTPVSDSITFMRRFDHQIARDGFLAVVSIQNGNAGGIPDLLAHCYNALSVGVSSGLHSTGDTTFDVAGRGKPELVVPEPQTSFAVPRVSGLAALLLQVIDENGALAAANAPQVLKALLMAGATKDEFPFWSHLPSKPLDDTFGAGELNAYNSYRILAGGQQAPGTNAVAALTGWDANTSSVGTTTRYHFDVPANTAVAQFSAILNWHRTIVDVDPSPAFNPGAFVADLNLALYRAVNGFPVEQLEISNSSVDNVEHIVAMGLDAGEYLLEITADSAVTYGLAWRSDTVNAPDITEIRQAAGGVEVDASLTPGHTYRLERSNDLDRWSPVQSISAVSATHTFLDANPADANNAYRVIMEY